MARIRKKRSKRQSLKLKYKIEKNVRQHKRKVKKEVKKLEKMGIKKRIKKNNGIPNKFPYKQEILDNLRKMKEDQKIHNEEKMKKESGLENLVQKINVQITKKEDTKTNSDKKFAQPKSRKELTEDLNHIIDKSDIILEILDSRSPNKCRAIEYESKIKSLNKLLILVINKIELVPLNINKEWLNIIRKENIAILFEKSSLNSSDLEKTTLRNDSQNLNFENIINGDAPTSGSNLLEVINNIYTSKNIIHSKPIKLIGIIGYPNVGKEYILTSLVENSHYSVEEFLKDREIIHEIELSKNSNIFNNPGTIFQKEQDEFCLIKCALQNETTKNYTEAIKRLLSEQRKEVFLLTYEIQDFQDEIEFLTHIASRKGFLKKKKKPDFEKSARQVLKDWIEGILKIYETPK